MRKNKPSEQASLGKNKSKGPEAGRSFVGSKDRRKAIVAGT